MSLSITFLGHAGFIFDDGTSKLVVDPFLTGNELAKQKPEEIDCQYLALTHAHEDHFGDTLKIVKRTDATVVSNFEICTYLGEHGVENVEPGNTGGKIETPFGWIAFTQAFHSSSYQGRYMGQPCGLMIHMGDVTMYHCGDTGLFGDMKLLGEIYQPEVAIIPVGDRFTMGPELATRAAEMIQPRYAIPVHYGTFGLLRQGPEGFEPAGIVVKALEPGQTWRYE